MRIPVLRITIIFFFWIIGAVAYAAPMVWDVGTWGDDWVGTESTPINGSVTKSSFGSSVAFIGDVNDDDYGDYIVGSYLQQVNAGDAILKNAGQARIISGKTGLTLHTFEGDASKDYFGFAVANAGDVNDDGVNDVVVGGYLADKTNLNGTVTKDAGTIKVFSGATGLLIYQQWGSTTKEYFGYAVAGGNDINGDGDDDVVVGSPLADKMNPSGALIKDVGKVQIFTGVDGELYRTYEGDAATDNLGRAVAVISDLNSDGWADIVVGAPLSDNNALKDSGYVRLYSPAADITLDTWSDALAGDNFGWSVAAAGDVNDDNIEDVIVGAYKADIITPTLIKDVGAAYVISSAGNVLHTFTGTIAKESFGFVVVGIGDINDDDHDDVMVGNHLYDAPIPESTKKLKDAGRVIVYSGSDGGSLFSVKGIAAGDYFGWTVSGGDTNNDNVPDLLVGAPKDDVVSNVTTLKDAGSITVISGAAMLAP